MQLDCNRSPRRVTKQQKPPDCKCLRSAADLSVSQKPRDGRTVPCRSLRWCYGNHKKQFLWHHQLLDKRPGAAYWGQISNLSPPSRADRPKMWCCVRVYVGFGMIRPQETAFSEETEVRVEIVPRERAMGVAGGIARGIDS